MNPEKIFAFLLCAAFLMALYCIFMFAPTEATMGDVQRIFYFHVPSAWAGFLGIFFLFGFSLLFLITRRREWDICAASAAEVGAVFCTLVLASGPLWAKSVWGIYWTWDARLTSFFVLWLIYLGYLLLRSLVESPLQRARLSAVFGILGAMDVPVVYFSTRWWRTQHPAPVLAGGEQSGLDSRMLVTLMISLTAFTLLFLYLWRMRCKLEHSADRLEAVHRQFQAKIQEGK
jgi:heme exporter protein C